MMRRRVLAAGAAALAMSVVHASQPPTPFRAETRLVVLHATVRNDRGELVTNLDRPAFTVYENGKRQPVALFRRDDVPVSLGLLIDNSGSMRTLRARVEAAALAFVRASNPDDEAFVINFADRPRLDVAMTRDVHAIESGIARVDSIGGTAVLDAVDAAETYLRAHATRDRKALLIVTDGKDNASEKTMKQIQDAAERSDTVVYAVGLFADGDASAKQGRKELDDLTGRTGGAAYYPADVDQIQSVVLDLAHQIRQQYTVGYTPINQALDGSYRTIRVEARGRERLVVRTRAGYRAAPP
jgi:VWFA-related protein